MIFSMFRIRTIAWLASIIMGLSACAPAKPVVSGMPGQAVDIHERLSEVIRMDGFDPRLHIQQFGSLHYDSVFVRVPLDGLKRRHPSIDRLVKDIGKICALQTYAHLPIRIEIGTADEDDRMYLYALLATAIGGKSNIRIVTNTDSINDIVVVVFHKSGGGS